MNINNIACIEELKNSLELDANLSKIAEKLMGRDILPIYRLKTQEFIKGKVILITGAGGSIGSEIVKQLIALKAEKIYVLFLVYLYILLKRNFRKFPLTLRYSYDQM